MLGKKFWLYFCTRKDNFVGKSLMPVFVDCRTIRPSYMRRGTKKFWLVLKTVRTEFETILRENVSHQRYLGTEKLKQRLRWKEAILKCTSQMSLSCFIAYKISLPNWKWIIQGGAQVPSREGFSPSLATGPDDATARERKKKNVDVTS